jgi:hypothetical protein
MKNMHHLRSTMNFAHMFMCVINEKGESFLNQRYLRITKLRIPRTKRESKRETQTEKPLNQRESKRKIQR